MEPYENGKPVLYNRKKEIVVIVPDSSSPNQHFSKKAAEEFNSNFNLNQVPKLTSGKTKNFMSLNEFQEEGGGEKSVSKYFSFGAVAPGPQQASKDLEFSAGASSSNAKQSKQEPSTIPSSDTNSILQSIMKAEKLPRYVSGKSSFYASKVHADKWNKTVPVFLPPKPKASSLAPKITTKVNPISDDDDEEGFPFVKRRKLVRKIDMEPESPLQDPSLPNEKAKSFENVQKTKAPIIIDDEEEEEDINDGNHEEVDAETLRIHGEIAEFLNTADEAEMIDCIQCTPQQAKFIKSSRPLESYQNWTEKFHESPGLSKLVQKYKVILQDLGRVDGIIKHCDFTAKEIKSVMDEWEEYRSKGIKPLSRYKCLLEQPATINPNMKLKQYQLIGISWMLMLYEKGLGGILADEMGLGKTAQVISLLGTLYDQGQTGPHLIVVPSSTLDNWMREITMWCPCLSSISYAGSMAERRDLQYDIMENEDLNIVVTTYTIATGNAEDRRFLRGRSFKTLFLDEGHMIKNGGSQRAKHIKNLKIPFKLLITGTPMQNNLMELLSLLTFIMPDIFEPAKGSFEAIFDLKPTNNRLEDDVSRRRLEHAKSIMTPFVLRRKKDDVLNDIPPKTREVVYCKMTAEQKALYHRVLRSSKKEHMKALEQQKDEKQTKKKSSKKEEGGVTLLNNVLMQLRKVANHQLLLRSSFTDEMLPKMAKDIMQEVEFMDSTLEYVIEDMSVMSDFQLHKLCAEYSRVSKYQLPEKSWMDSGKVIQLAEMLPKMIENGDRILLFSQFVIMLDILEYVMASLNIRFIRLDGSIPGNERLDLIDSYNNNPEIKVFLLSTKAAGLGINLTSANVVILYDIDFNPHNDAQAEDRAHRVGQQRPVRIYKLILDGSVEQHMLTCANFKLLLDTKVQNIDDGGADQPDPKEEEKLMELLRNDMMNESEDEL